MASHKQIWVTRPREDSEHFASELADSGVPALVGPVMHIVHMPLTELPKLPDALLLTSRHAAQTISVLPTAWCNLPTYCIGPATAEYGRDFGLTHLIPGSTDLTHLLPRMAAELPGGARIVYFCGEDTRHDASVLGTARGLYIEPIVAYRAPAEAALGENIIEALRENHMDGVAFFSPRSATLAIELMKKAGVEEYAHKLTAYCLSLDVAKAAGALNWKSLRACHLPTRRDMLELIISHRAKTL